jgi:hypothetical protein
MLLTPEEREATVMFYDTCEDVDGDKVPRPMMKRLAELGLVVRLKGRWYIGTPAGEQVHAEFIREEMRRYEKGKHIQHFLGWLMILNQEQFSAVMTQSGHCNPAYHKKEWRSFQRSPLGFAYHWTPDFFAAWTAINKLGRT